MDETPQSDITQQPLNDLDDWEADLLRRYPETNAAFSAAPDAASNGPTAIDDGSKQPDAFRQYESEDTRSGVREFYRLNHTHQTVDFVRQKRAEYLSLQKRRMGIWEALEFLNALKDDSDPDTELPQIEHCLQTAEAIRRDGHPDWFILTGLIHDLGKILCLFGEPQWAVVGDTFPVGCRFSEKIVFHEFFDQNPDSENPGYATELGIYERQTGLDNVLLSWGHDEYLYHVVKGFLPTPALYMIRYHSFYPGHRECAYDHLMNKQDREMFSWVRAFNPYDLYTKSHERPDVGELRPYYEQLIARYFPSTLAW